MSTFDSTKTQLGALLRAITEGKIQLPDFQRGWVWNDEHIRSLLVSIARSFPIGAIMLLESGGEARFKVRPVEGVCPAMATPDKVEKLILDGQQRLTSLTQVLMTDRPVQTEDEKKRKISRYYYIDIEEALRGPEYYETAIIGVDDDRTIRENFGRDIKIDLRTPEREYARFCFPCSQIMNSDKWEEGLNEYDSSKFGRYMLFRKVILNIFRSYDVPVIELKKDNKKEAVCLVFEKVNTGGVSLSVFELITATYAADGVNLRDEWFGNTNEKAEGIHQKLGRHRLLRDIQATDFFQGLSLLYTYSRRLQDLASGRSGKQLTAVSAKRESVLALPLEAYRQYKDQLVNGFTRAAKFLRKESFFSNNDLPYRTQVIPLASVLALLGDRWLEQKVNDKLSRWFWCGILGELYGGAVETRIALDLQGLMDWISGGQDEPGTVRDANFQPGRLDTLRTRNSAAYKGISVLIQRDGARDFFWKSTVRDLDETDWEECKLDIHHLFPRAWCETRGIGPKRYDSILNKTPISFKANRMIGGKAPSEYLQQLQTHASIQLTDADMDQILASHCLDPVVLRKDDFDGFVESRRGLIIAKITKAMGKQVVATGEAIADDDVDEEAA